MCLLLGRLETTMTKLGRSVNKLKLDLFLVLPRNVGHQTLQSIEKLKGLYSTLII